MSNQPSISVEPTAGPSTTARSHPITEPTYPPPSNITTLSHPLAEPLSTTSSEIHTSSGIPHDQRISPNPTGTGEGTDKGGSTTPPVPMVHLRVLVISGQSHVFTFEPETTVGRMKELLWSMWPPEWTSPAQPPSPSFLRVLHAGRVLGDDSTLTSNNLPAALPPTQPTVIHLSVRSFSIHGDEDPKKPSLLHPTSSRRSRTGGEDEVSGCKCTIM